MLCRKRNLLAYIQTVRSEFNSAHQFTNLLNLEEDTTLIIHDSGSFHYSKESDQ